MKKLVAAVFLMVGIVGTGYGYEIPEDVKQFLDNYAKDSTAYNGPLEYKRMGVIPNSIQIKDLRLRALQVYCFKMISLDEISLNEYPDTVALSEIIMPTNRWRILVMAHNEPLYELQLVKRDGKLGFGGASFPSPGSRFKSSVWELLLESYPESNGINPVFVTTETRLAPDFSSGDRFLYFKQKGPRKVHYIKRGYAQKTDTLATLFTGSIENLDDSRKYVAYRKKRKPPPEISDPKAIELIKRNKLRRAQAAENEGQK